MLRGKLESYLGLPSHMGIDRFSRHKALGIKPIQKKAPQKGQPTHYNPRGNNDIGDNQFTIHKPSRSPMLLPTTVENNKEYGLRRRSSQIIDESGSINEGPRERVDSMSVFKHREMKRGKSPLSPSVSPRLSASGLQYL
jgi:hypothetical protein